jgi:formiminoglutamase
MNLSDYFEPVDFSQYNNDERSLGKYGLGQAIEKTTRKLTGTSWKAPRVVIFGVPADHGKPHKKGASAPDKIRNALYRLAAIDEKVEIADMGNLKFSKNQRGTFLALRDVVEYLREHNITTVVLGGSQELTAGICEAFKSERHFWLTTIDAVPDIKKGVEAYNSKNYLTRLFKNYPGLFQYSLLACQQHLTGDKLLNKLPVAAEHIRLGILRDDIKKAEPVLRNSHVVSFDMGAVKYNEAPATSQKNPNGLKGEEACQLAHYAGIGYQTSVFGLFEILAGSDKDGLTSALAAEIVWYFLNGVTQRSHPGKRTTYKVEIEGLDHSVVFKNEQETGRWWFEVESLSGEKLEVACTEEDYRQATENEIPARWFRFLQKLDRASK